MKESQQLGLADHLLNTRRKQSKMLSKLSKIDDLVDWKQVVNHVRQRWSTSKGSEVDD